jgi:hypothetical protein
VQLLKRQTVHMQMHCFLIPFNMDGMNIIRQKGNSGAVLNRFFTKLI